MSVSQWAKYPLGSSATCVDNCSADTRRLPRRWEQEHNPQRRSVWVTVSQPVGGVLSTGSLAGVRMGDHPSMRPTRKDLRADRPLPVWPCSEWGLPSRPGRPGRWCALTAPFHPYLFPPPQRALGHRRSVFCGTFLRVTPTGCKPASCPMEPRPSSAWSPRRVPAAITQSTHRRLPVWPKKFLASPDLADYQRVRHENPPR